MFLGGQGLDRASFSRVGRPGVSAAVSWGLGPGVFCLRGRAHFKPRAGDGLQAESPPAGDAGEVQEFEIESAYSSDDGAAGRGVEKPVARPPDDGSSSAGSEEPPLPGDEGNRPLASANAASSSSAAYVCGPDEAEVEQMADFRRGGSRSSTSSSESGRGVGAGRDAAAPAGDSDEDRGVG